MRWWASFVPVLALAGFGIAGRVPRSSAGAAAPADHFQCHNTNAAVDKSFVQFYPALLPIARAKGTLNAAYVAAEKAEGS